MTHENIARTTIYRGCTNNIYSVYRCGHNGYANRILLPLLLLLLLLPLPLLTATTTTTTILLVLSNHHFRCQLFTAAELLQLVTAAADRLQQLYNIPATQHYRAFSFFLMKFGKC